MNTIKSKIARSITGRLLPAILATITMAITANVLAAMAKAESFLPGLSGVIHPGMIADCAGEIATGLVLLAVARMLGVPVRDIQGDIHEIGKYDGAQDGLCGPKTREAIAKAINDPGVRVIHGRLTSHAKTRRITPSKGGM